MHYEVGASAALYATLAPSGLPNSATLAPNGGARVAVFVLKDFHDCYELSEF
jgi:hypothetical protein